MSLGNRGNSISLDELVVLNEEMAALVRAGIPLDTGMAGLSDDLPGRLGVLANEISQRLSKGESLPQILADDGRSLPTVWRAVVESGLRAGELPLALESMATTGRNIADMRQAVMTSLVYPLFVVFVAIVSLVLLTTRISPVMLVAFHDFTERESPLLSSLVWLGRHSVWWAGFLPMLGAICLATWWFTTSRAHVLSNATLIRWPASLALLRNSRLATFTEILSLLVRQNVPFHEGIELASQASGDRNLRDAGATVAASLRQGKSLSVTDVGMAAFPPLLGWLLAYGGQTETLSRMLQEMSQRYRHQARRAANFTAVFLPIIITVVVGGTVVLLEAIAVFLPLTQFYTDLARHF